MVCYLSTASIYLLLTTYSFTFPCCVGNKLIKNQKHGYQGSFFRLNKTIPSAANPVALLVPPLPASLPGPFSRTQRNPSVLQAPASCGSIATLGPLLFHCPLPCYVHTPALLIPSGNLYRWEETMANAKEIVCFKRGGGSPAGMKLPQGKTLFTSMCHFLPGKWWERGRTERSGSRLVAACSAFVPNRGWNHLSTVLGVDRTTGHTYAKCFTN